MFWLCLSAFAIPPSLLAPSRPLNSLPILYPLNQQPALHFLNITSRCSVDCSDPTPLRVNCRSSRQAFRYSPYIASAPLAPLLCTSCRVALCIFASRICSVLLLRSPDNTNPLPIRSLLHLGVPAAEQHSTSLPAELAHFCCCLSRAFALAPATPCT